MKMFVFRYLSYGAYSYAVLAETEEEARKAVRAFAGEEYIYDASYEVGVYAAGEVAQVCDNA